MMSARKSPNMMSTTGRMPAMAAPTANPVNPASEIGVSTTRSLPNSSTRPFTTLKGVPASATSSPKSTTLGSRRISSLSASRIASPKESSRPAATVSGIDILVNAPRVGIGRVLRELDGGIHFSGHFPLDAIQHRLIRQTFRHKPCLVQRYGIAVRHPTLLFVFRPVVFARDVADMVAAKPVRVQQQKPGAVAAALASHHSRC